MVRRCEQIYKALYNDELKQQILEHLEMPNDSKIVGGFSTLFFDGYHKVVVEIPIHDETGVADTFLTPLVASYETIRDHLNGNSEARSRIKNLV
ncbi:hypothetical protein [Ruminococcus sp.]|uniref:hypothetical protein n=1 Tax=Ruminococcus sp. TaxID=41978 RepID=UPI0025EF85F8|nr:hypothetical protein [Ruminococcus sp.]